MAKVILEDVVNLQNETSATNKINQNMDRIEVAIENTLSRDGRAPNEMRANIDMNSNRILNLPAPLSDAEPVRLVDVGDASVTVAQAILDEMQGLVDGLSVIDVDLQAQIDALETDKLDASSYTAADVLSKLLTVDGAASGLDADLLDGNSSAFFATATGLSDHLADTTAAHAATAISNTPAGNIAATTVQAAIDELDTEKLGTAAAAAAYQPLDSDLTSIAALTTTTAGRSTLAIADPNADRVLAWDDSAGAVAPIALTDITTEAAPAAGDYILIYGAEGDFRKSNWNTLPSGGSGFTSINIQTFTANGTYTPTSGMAYCIIECVGSGGAGGSCDGVTTGTNAGGGGGAGAYSRKFATAATIGASQTVTIGAAGAAGAAGNNAGGNGNTTSVGTICVAVGGSGGTAGNQLSNIGTGGAGGAASGGTGDVKLSGGAGNSAMFATITTARVPITHGGDSFFGRGAKSTAISNNTAGAGTAAASTAYGGGGGGAQFHDTTSDAAGGAGGPGLVVITEFIA